MDSPIRVRYAPSPTGLQHIGGIRTALFNYLYALSAGGTFILRLEDTDRSRYGEEFVRNLYDTFKWLGIHWDEGPDTGGPCGPYIQSQRTDLYRRHAQELLDSGRAYRCFCTSERLEKVRLEREAARSPESGYDRLCRAVPKEESDARAASGEAFTIRLKIPLEDETGAPALTRFSDKLLGDIEWKNADINPDPVLLKSDGFPTYHLANIIDDHYMKITHVLRAQEWLSSTPLHVILYRAFGWESPEFCHLPMVMGQDGKKLSKRHGATSIDEFRRQGYLPEALLNYVALLGCSYEEGRDLYTLKELGSLFKIGNLNKAPAVFDYKKLEWYNGQYIRMKSDEELAGAAAPFASEAGFSAEEIESGLFRASMSLVKERIVFLSEIPGRISYLFKEAPCPAAEEFIPKKSDLCETIRLLRIGRTIAGELSQMDDEKAEAFVKEKAASENIKLGDLLMPLRVAVTGARVSPPLFGSLRLLGAEKCLARIDGALAFLEGESARMPDRPEGGSPV